MFHTLCNILHNWKLSKIQDPYPTSVFKSDLPESQSTLQLSHLARVQVTAALDTVPVVASLSYKTSSGLILTSTVTLARGGCCEKHLY